MKNRAMISGLMALALVAAVPALGNAAAQNKSTTAEQVAAPEKPAAVMDAPRGERGPKGPRMTPEQRQKMEAAYAKYEGKLQALEDQIFVKHQELRALHNASQPDVKAVGAKANEIVKLRHELADVRREMAKEAGLPMPAWGGPCGPGFGPKHHGKRGNGPRGCQPCPGAEL